MRCLTPTVPTWPSPGFARVFCLLWIFGSAGQSTAQVAASGAKETSSRDGEFEAARIAMYAKARDAAFDEAEKAVDPPSRSFRTARFFVTYDCDQADAKDACRHSEAVFDWLESRFGWVGTGLVQALILEVHQQKKDSQVLNKIPDLPAATQPAEVMRIVYTRTTALGHGSPFQPLSPVLFHYWLDQKCAGLRPRLPSWLMDGLNTFIDDALLKGAKLTFQPNRRERDDRLTLKKYAEDRAHSNGVGKHETKLLALIDLFRGKARDLAGDEAVSLARSQAVAVVRYLLEGPGKDDAKTKLLLERYLRSLVEQVAKAAANSDQVVSDQMIWEHAFAQTFADWNEKDWATFERRWWNWIENGD